MAKNPDTRQGQRRRYLRARERLVELQAFNNRQRPKRRRKPEKIVVSVSDPEAALGRDKHNVFRPLYNVQLVRDLDSPLCLGYQVFAQPTDAGTFSPMLERVTNFTGVKPKSALVDAAYVTACNLAICDQAGIALYGPWQENDFSQTTRKQGTKPLRLGKEHFTRVPEQNMYRCPEGQPMPWIGQEKRRQSDGQINVVHKYGCSPQHCRVCPRQAVCSTHPHRGRTVKRSEHEALVEAHRADGHRGGQKPLPITWPNGGTRLRGLQATSFAATILRPRLASRTTASRPDRPRAQPSCRSPRRIPEKQRDRHANHPENNDLKTGRSLQWRGVVERQKLRERRSRYLGRTLNMARAMATRCCKSGPSNSATTWARMSGISMFWGHFSRQAPHWVHWEA